MQVPDRVLTALTHVRAHYPEVAIVVFNSAGRWQYMDAYYGSPKFGNEVNVSILEDAAESVESLPAVFEHPEADLD